MSWRSSNVTRDRWAVQLLDVQPNDRDIELGCGPGLAMAAFCHPAVQGLVGAMQLGALDLPAKHGKLVAQDKYLGFGIRGDPAQQENASDDRVDERVEHGGGCYEIGGPRTSPVSVPHR
jgi:hypothetical protein